MRSETYDALVVIVGASALAMPELMSNAINSCLGSTDKPVLAYISPMPQRALRLRKERRKRQDGLL